MVMNSKPPAAAPLVGPALLIVGASYVSRFVVVPDKLHTVREISFILPQPDGVLSVISWSDIQLVPSDAEWCSLA